MALVLADRVKESTATTGTGTLTLAGAFAQFQAFSAGVGTGNTTYYTLLSGNGTDWETGLGTLGGAGPFTLARTTIFASSNSNAAINLSGTSTVFCDLPASKLNQQPNFAAVGMSVPTTGTFTWINQGGAAASDNTNGPMTITAPATAGNSLRFFGQAIPLSAPWTATAMFTVNMSANNFHYAGIAITDGTKFILHCWFGGNNYNSEIIIQSWTNTTTFNGQLYGSGWTISGPALFFRIYNDATNYNFQVSGDGKTYTTVATQAVAAFLTATRVGFLFENQDASNFQIVMNVHGWEATTGTGTPLAWPS